MFQIYLKRKKSPKIASLLLSKIQFKISHLQLHRQKLTGKEFDILTKSNNIQTVVLENVKVKDFRGKVCPVEKVLENFSNAYSIK
uniref:Uncharacterized protein n=1 Tax=Panagrolaimus sp. ES5 TaxID=591445 RepID=A0AC34G262_9BILA